ncbi:MAG: hypothetical protein VW405_21105, partial [Rhodospirillaceae bacterium]
ILLFQCAIFPMADLALDYAVRSDPNDTVAARYLALTREALADEVGSPSLSSGDDLDLAETFAAQLDFARAEAHCRRAVAAQADDEAAALKLAQIVGLRGDSAEQTRLLEAVLARHPNSLPAQGYLCNAYLSAARLDVAWPLYESRLKRPRGSSPRPPPPLPRWNGAPLEGRKLLIWREEGVGDEIRFSSCLPDAVRAAAGEVVYECDPRLVSLYARSFPGVTVRAEDRDNARLDGIDCQVPAGSLPMLFRPGLDAFPADGSFLQADPARVAAWRRRLDALPPGPKVGAGWRSLNAGWHKLLLHSRLEDWRPLAAVPGLQLVSLQSGLRAGEAEAGAAALGIPVHRFEELDVDDDMEAAAALVSALDAVVACQCWLLHLGGALGVKVYSFNARPNPYTMGRDVNPWAPGTKIFYKDAGADWTAPMTRIAACLTERFAS